MNLFILLALIYVFTFLVGILFEKVRIPWVFSALLLGILFSIYNPFSSVTSSQSFTTLAELGMYFMLFIIGFELDLTSFKKHSFFIFKATAFIILFATFFGALLFYFVFHYSILISVLIALSFATVGEAILIPVLDEFKMINTKLGQTIIGIGTFDDIFEVFTLLLLMFLVGKNSSIPHTNIVLILLSLFGLFSLTVWLTRLKEKGSKFWFTGIEQLLIFVFFIFFIFLGVGEYAHATAIGAVLSGIALKNFIPNKRLKLIESDIRSMAYGFFTPLFFFWVGKSITPGSIFKYPLLLLLILVVANGAKILAVWIVGRNEMNAKESLLLGIGLLTRFSTSIIVIKILFERGLIAQMLYSLLIVSSAFSVFVPLLFSYLLNKWGMVQQSKHFIKKR
ncbi:MAG: hypothetical protein PWP03_739 [Candidatus Woesearchaeota archaeon]|nr:hypothetical protein [Candidatus Woesearchaeota archaeon]MDN5328101.1 hypothetical protein [Candidatus Woesearchaeota archaeon]